MIAGVIHTENVPFAPFAASGSSWQDHTAFLTGSSGNAPVANEDGSLHLVFYGMICNTAALRDELGNTGHPFRSNDPGELLLRLYEEKGDSFVRELDGAFAFALWDARREKLLLGRDRAGLKPLYYFQHKNSLVFAGDLPTLRKHPDFPAEIRCQAVADFLSLQYVPTPGTVYRNVFKLPPASILRFDLANGTCVVKKYWELKFLPKQKISFTDAKMELRRRVTHAVQKRLEADASYGVFLSGGVDSGIIAAVMAQLLPGEQIPAFTIGFEDAAYDERSLARSSGEFINNLSGGKLILQEKTLHAIPFRDFCKWFKNTGEPYCDTSLLPAGALCAFAREQVTAALCGDAADELFGGYERYQAMKLAQLCNILPETFRKCFFRKLLLEHLADAGERTFSGRLRRLCRTLGEDASRQYFSILDRCPAEIRQELFGDRLKGLTDPASVFGLHLNARNIADRCMETDFHLYLASDAIPKMHYAATAAGLDVRSPFLDREVMEFAASLPASFKVHGRERKYILREAFADCLAPEIFRGRKKGFGVPVGNLLRTIWQKDVPGLLFADPLFREGWLNRNGVEKLWQEHLDGKRDHTYILCSILALSLFLESDRKGS